MTTRIQLRGVAYLGCRVDIDYTAAALSVTVQPPSTTPALEQTGSISKRSYAAPVSSPGLFESTGSESLLAVYPSREPLRERSQVGRVVLKGGVVVAQQGLVLVDAAGNRHALIPGATVALPLQSVSIMSAAA